MNRIRYSSRPIAVDIFAGAGGLSLGLEQAGFDVVLAVDRDGYHVATHQRNFPYGIAVCTSVADFDVTKARALMGTDREIDLVAGGPPCQGFSQMGTRDSRDPRNSLVYEYVRLVLELQPRAFLMENVPGMQSGATARIFGRALAKLEAGGYSVSKPVRTLNTADFGVPQIRERLFVLGLRSDVGGEISYPRAPTEEHSVRTTVEDAIADLPSLRAHPEMLEQDWTEYDESGAELSYYARVLRGLEKAPSDYSYSRAWDRSRCTCSRAVRHRPDVVELYAATRPGDMVPGHKLPRLLPSGCSPTLRAGSESEHGSYTAPRPVHPREPRCITAREAARLHGYPDWFVFYPGKWHAYRQIGNSVCPPVARALGASLVAALGVRPQHSATVLQLQNEFSLPATMPKQHRRITQLSEWPKILRRLLENAQDASGRLARPDFSISDVRRAYKDTNARMPRNPPHRFLADLARSRNVSKLLRPVLDAQLTIIEVGNREAYGRFVPRGTTGAIDTRQVLSISSKELSNATEIRTKRKNPLSDVSIAAYVRRRSVAKVVFGDGRLVLHSDSDPKGQSEQRGLRFDVLKGQRRTLSGRVLVARYGSLPTLPQLTERMARQRDKACLLLALVTRRHLAAFLVVSRAGRTSVRRKALFQVVQAGDSGPAKRGSRAKAASEGAERASVTDETIRMLDA